MIDGNKTPDAEISPMEAQNEGQGRKGSSDNGPLPQTKRGRAERQEEEENERIRKGGETAGRDDL